MGTPYFFAAQVIDALLESTNGTLPAEIDGSSDDHSLPLGARQQLQGPTGTSCGWVRTGRRDQQRFLFARELAACSGARLFAEPGLQIAEHEAALGPVDGGPTHADAGRDRLVARPGVSGQ